MAGIRDRRSMRGITRHPDGRYEIKVSIDGKRCSFGYASNQKDAIKHRNQIWDQIDKGTLVLPREVTVAEHLDTWLDTIKKTHKLAPASVDAYRHQIRRLNEHLGSIRLTDLTTRQVDETYAAMSDRYAASVVHKAHAVLSMAMDVAVDWYDLPRNVVRRATAPKPEYDSPTTLSKEEVEALLHAAKDHRLYAFWHLLLVAALRKGEALALHWEDIDDEHGLVHVRGSLSRQSEGLTIGPTKTKGSSRVIPIDDQTLAVLQAHRKRQLQDGMACRDQKFGNLVFTTRSGRPIDPKGIWDHFQRLCGRAGIDPRCIHALRHTSGSLMIDTGTDTLIVARVMGHTTTDMTSRYVHPDVETLRRAVSGASGAIMGHSRHEIAGSDQMGSG